MRLHVLSFMNKVGCTNTHGNTCITLKLNRLSGLDSSGTFHILQRRVGRIEIFLSKIHQNTNKCTSIFVTYFIHSILTYMFRPVFVFRVMFLLQEYKKASVVNCVIIISL